MELKDIFTLRKNQWGNIKNIGNKSDSEVECPDCGEVIDTDIIKGNYMVCPNCKHYYTMSTRRRINSIVDSDSFRELYSDIVSYDPLKFPNYKNKLKELNSGKKRDREAVVTGTACIAGIPVCIGVMDSRFLMGSMGYAVGEKIVRLAEKASSSDMPLILFAASGGARMQEGMFSLMQMSRTTAAIEKFKAQGGLYISYLTHPTTGGVSASFAFLGDIIIAEPKSLICFAGPRVIEQTIGQKLPEGFQRAEYLLEHGMIDMIVDRRDSRKMLEKILRVHGCGKK